MPVVNRLYRTLKILSAEVLELIAQPLGAARPRGRCLEQQREALGLRRIMPVEVHDAAVRIDAEHHGVLRKCTAAIVIAPGEVQHTESMCAQELLQGVLSRRHVTMAREAERDLGAKHGNCFLRDGSTAGKRHAH